MNKDVFQKELLQGERILWIGQPDPSVRFAKADAFLIPFSILWGGFALFWEGAALTAVGASKDPAALIFPLFGIPFVVIGLYFIFGRFWYKAKKKKRTYYAVTDKRVLVLSDFFSRHFEAAFINSIPVINKSVKTSGTGTIIFGNTNFFATMYGNTGMDFFASYYGVSAPAFYDIKDVESVYQQVNNLRNNQSPDS